MPTITLCAVLRFQLAAECSATSRNARCAANRFADIRHRIVCLVCLLIRIGLQPSDRRSTYCCRDSNPPCAEANTCRHLSPAKAIAPARTKRHSKRLFQPLSHIERRSSEQCNHSALLHHPRNFRLRRRPVFLSLTDLWRCKPQMVEFNERNGVPVGRYTVYPDPNDGNEYVATAVRYRTKPFFRQWRMKKASKLPTP